MTAPKHSPLPWALSKVDARIDDANGEPVEDGPFDRNSIANTHLIITAVNSHAALLAAAKRVIATAHYSPNRGTFCEDQGAFNDLADAIAKAET